MDSHILSIDSHKVRTHQKYGYGQCINFQIPSFMKVPQNDLNVWKVYTSTDPADNMRNIEMPQKYTVPINHQDASCLFDEQAQVKGSLSTINPGTTSLDKLIKPRAEFCPPSLIQSRVYAIDEDVPDIDIESYIPGKSVMCGKNDVNYRQNHHTSEFSVGQHHWEVVSKKMEYTGSQLSCSSMSESDFDFLANSEDDQLDDLDQKSNGFSFASHCQTNKSQAD